MKKIMIILLCVLLQACSTYCTSCALRVVEGKQAFDKGDFKSAFNKLMPAAVAGNAQAEYAVGYMYYYGYGVPEDTDSGLFWIHRSADQHFPPAMHALAVANNSDN